jgi:hypothetical protein
MKNSRFHTIARILLLLVFFSFNQWLFAFTTVVGTGTATQEQPFGMFEAYTRAATLYSTPSGLITSLAWYVGIGYPVSCPIKIYMKVTSSTSLTSVTWNTMKSGATLVYDGIFSFGSAGWKTIDIADFVNTGSKVIVMCEANYGNLGVTSYPVFRYTVGSTTAGTHEFWEDYDTATVNNAYGIIASPTSPSPNNHYPYRPNITITYFTLGIPYPPSGFMASAENSSQINLAWTRNSTPDNVMVAWNSTNSFGTPSGTYVAGNVISGGGTVIYNGAASAFNHSGLNSATTYYYKAWSVNGATPNYSTGVSSYDTTFCPATNSFASITDFEASTFPPQCWSKYGFPWARSLEASGYGSGMASAKADFFTYASGDFNLISPQVDLSSLSNPVIKFDHAYATSTAEIDKLELWYSTDNGATYSLLATLLGGVSGPLNTGGTSSGAFVPTPGQWATKSYSLSASTNKVMFRAISAYGNNLYLDNITFSGTCSPPTGLSASNITDNSADLSWTSYASSWQVKWGNAGFDTLTGGILISSVTSNPYTLGGLVASHAYSYYVRSSCGGLLSVWTGPYNFSTIAGVVSSVTWNGSVSSDWNNPLNWTPAVVPVASQDVIIPGSLVNYPVVSTSGMTCKDMSISTGANMGIGLLVAITIQGDLTILEGASLNNQGTIVLKGNLDNQNPN